MLQAFYDRFFKLQFSADDTFDELRSDARPGLELVRDDESLHAYTVDQDGA